ncbi:glycosyltransferase family 4 protein [Rhodanobacter glycinis]|uniref:Glycosyltransferase involved in cell wall bisynthesis n=1 Tax=Rhodanobacter glycinis TaxID=582702 RepID=A0A1I4BHI7_9GAMM|nr:glycosyltransferase family 4 protein [Rhodanobacter glycinis]SFK67416.1 Glycosyltransferase involved in cell wall bisynthesis [Rhodanobacter glycinis]
MRLIFVCKRCPQNRDLLDRPYGRFHYLPRELAKLGHEVTVLLVSHQNHVSEHRVMDDVAWVSHDIRRRGPLFLDRLLTQETRKFSPDLIIGLSDSWAGWLAYRLAKKLNVSLAIDAYDNYEAYMPWNLPMHWLWRRAIRVADLVTSAGPQLAQRLQSHRRGGHDVEVLSMAADPEFVPRDKSQCRDLLNLPQHVPLIGYIGSWAHNRGTSMLLDAFRRARKVQPTLRMVLSGRPPDYALREQGVIASGYVSDDALPTLINALDIACVVTADTSFGRYSYPAKLCEAMACGVPVVATATDPVRWMLGNRPEHLVPIGDASMFSQRVLDLLAVPRAEYGPRTTWAMQAERLDYLLRSVIRQNR